MSLDARLHELIRAAWNVMENNYDEAAIVDWREKASACLDEMFGPDHHYCRQFRRSLARANKLSLLAGGGVLEAAKATGKVPKLEDEPQDTDPASMHRSESRVSISLVHRDRQTHLSRTGGGGLDDCN